MSNPSPSEISRVMSALAKRKRVVTPAMLEQRRRAIAAANAKRVLLGQIKVKSTSGQP